MAILEKVWIWPIIMNSVRPFQTKLMGVDQISQFRPNFTISAKFHNPGILGIPGVRAVSQFFRCFFTNMEVPNWGDPTWKNSHIFPSLTNYTYMIFRFSVVDTLTRWKGPEWEPTKENEAKLNKITTFCKMSANLKFLYMRIKVGTVWKSLSII